MKRRLIRSLLVGAGILGAVLALETYLLGHVLLGMPAFWVAALAGCGVLLIGVVCLAVLSTFMAKAGGIEG